MKAMTKSIQFKKLSSEDLPYFEELITLFGEVFEMKELSIPGTDYLQRLLGKESFHAFVALHKGTVVGGLTAYTLDQYYSEEPLAYIIDLAVASSWQRQGIGQALITETKSWFQKHGYAEVFVQADRIDDYAIDFYRKTQPTAEEDVLHFYYTLR
jgi:aminoglycoside 3-N-acetyltransferase I